MDPLEAADAQLSRARAGKDFVVTPETAHSPMDAAGTLRIARSVVDDADPAAEADPDATAVIARARIREHDPQPRNPQQRDPASPEPAAMAAREIDPLADTPPEGIPRVAEPLTAEAAGPPAGELAQPPAGDSKATADTTRSAITRRLDGE